MTQDIEPQYHTAHVKALDGLRGYAAIAVTFFHAILHPEPALVNSILAPSFDAVARADLLYKAALTIFDGTAAVMLFYVLSGAVLCRSLLNSPLSAVSLGLFLARRALRLLPALTLCMVLMWGLSALYQFGGVGAYPVVSLPDAVNNALLLAIRVNSPSTSIQIEALATPFIVLFAIMYRRFAVPGSLLLFCLSLIAVERPELVFYLPNMNVSVLVFIAGMLAALAEAKSLFSTATTVKLITLLASCVLFRHFVHINAITGLIAQVILFGSLVGFVMHSRGTGFHRFLENRFSQFLGHVSYSYYLLNVPVLFIIWFSPGLDKLGNSAGIVGGGFEVGLLACAATLPLAWLSYRFCELPFIGLGKKLTNKFDTVKST
ncbi:MAG TPA: acyltransferase [Burkholderiaceae bacterium]|jgi:peptidoglycan/LPS O-acetylase OafA/YrhL